MGGLFGKTNKSPPNKTNKDNHDEHDDLSDPAQTPKDQTQPDQPTKKKTITTSQPTQTTKKTNNTSQPAQTTKKKKINMNNGVIGINAFFLSLYDTLGHELAIGDIIVNLGYENLERNWTHGRYDGIILCIDHTSFEDDSFSDPTETVRSAYGDKNVIVVAVRDNEAENQIIKKACERFSVPFFIVSPGNESNFYLPLEHLYQVTK